jgi:ammonium transporter, Amt family
MGGYSFLWVLTSLVEVTHVENYFSHFTGPVHIASGSAALAYAIILGRRRGPNGQILAKVPSYRPHNVTMVIIGIVFLWFGWFGFNGGSALNMSMRSIYAANNTNLAAASGLLSWVFLDYIYLGKWSAVGAASGALAGLVGNSPQMYSERSDH